MTGATAAAVGAAAALGASAGLTALPHLDLNADLIRVAAGSAGTVLAALTAYLFLLRARRTRALVDVIVTAGVTLLALVGATLSLLAGAHAAAGASPLGIPISVGAGLVISAAFAAAALMPDRPLDNPARFADRLLGWGIGVAVAMAAIVAVAIAVAPAHVGAVIGELLAAGLWASAALGFARRSQGGEQLTILWLAVAAAVLSVAQLTDALLPLSGTQDVSGGDLIQIAGMVALLVAGFRDFESDHRTRAATAVLDERRRLARELHDGLAQELAYIASHVSDAHLVEAAERAVEESRLAILALARPADEPLERIISDAAHSIGARGGIDVTVAVRPGIYAAPEVKAALLRILREAMGNAIRHGRAATAHVAVDGPSPVVMVVADDGLGYDVRGARRPDSLGLQSMRERAENLGGHMTMDSQVGEGTRVAVVIP